MAFIRKGSNRRHRRIGHVFQGRVKAILVERDAHWLELCRYVVLNPVRAQLVDQPGDWVWSNYRATAGLTACPPFLDVAWTWEQFGIRPASAQRRYPTFVAEGIGKPGPWSTSEDNCIEVMKPTSTVYEVFPRLKLPLQGRGH
jgi:putative transposase